MDIKALSEQYGKYAIERRRYYHAHPELPEQEIETCAQIKEDLLDIGITDIRTMSNCHGLVATIHGGRPGKTVALRTDIDALPVKEDTGLPFASKNENIMHACGHDAHIAILLGAAKMLFDCRDQLKGNVRLVVQPSEELATGAKAMISEGALDGVDAIYGSHVMGALDAPYYGISSGPLMAGAAIFNIRVIGYAAHGSEPHRGKDAITVSAAIINALQQCVSRMNDPRSPLVLTIGTIHGGSRFNIIPNEVKMEGTVRTFEAGTAVEEIMRRIVENTAAAFGTTAEFHFEMITPPVIHDSEKMVLLAKNAAEKLYGKQSVCDMQPLMGSEDFAYYLQKVPGVFGIIGINDVAKGYIYSNHHEKFDFEESAVVRGCAIMAQFAVDYLESET
ncbi:MAG: amidohydrolase [Clostridiales bacterium]|nr:amidohydrolase [Clostridiales bacterium]